ncbi:hypothetical protein BX616_008272 [Lobosporangium transversale]|uniref:Uncharacterized protein n=1 Tax=Lobosporangium transversale TaxID=64571 RepID=A0A1Y2GNL2_9FUNG|nr:hypothetical protein BCR41DRAFT_352874 [Lobosporangium transversale]KAF9914450.1 hypothetical protein BX616_008272 [Lobosporangium transversale]ORZ16638.1 hypothetical protein BCR41DRAFT_352874 [Lobosporangium transversale]|eukprot:XP_021881573.1 hypothetical protein BCR41DRAFT_352874 [Lobosporangium transversale]
MKSLSTTLCLVLASAVLALALVTAAPPNAVTTTADVITTTEAGDIPEPTSSVSEGDGGVTPTTGPVLPPVPSAGTSGVVVPPVPSAPIGTTGGAGSSTVSAPIATGTKPSSAQSFTSQASALLVVTGAATAIIVGF